MVHMKVQYNAQHNTWTGASNAHKVELNICMSMSTKVGRLNGRFNMPIAACKCIRSKSVLFLTGLGKRLFDSWTSLSYMTLFDPYLRLELVTKYTRS